MVSIEECKEYLSDLGLDDKKIEEIRDTLEAFVEQSLDFAFDADTIIKQNKNEQSNESKSQSDNILPSLIGEAEKRR